MILRYLVTFQKALTWHHPVSASWRVGPTVFGAVVFSIGRQFGVYCRHFWNLFYHHSLSFPCILRSVSREIQSNRPWFHRGHSWPCPLSFSSPGHGDWRRLCSWPLQKTLLLISELQRSPGGKIFGEIWGMTAEPPTPDPSVSEKNLSDANDERKVQSRLLVLVSISAESEVLLDSGYSCHLQLYWWVFRIWG